jgi:ATP-dependent Lhr-like helicase
VDSILIERLDGVPVLEPHASEERAAVGAALVDAGFARTPRGLRLR